MRNLSTSSTAYRRCLWTSPWLPGAPCWLVKCASRGSCWSLVLPWGIEQVGKWFWADLMREKPRLLDLCNWLKQLYNGHWWARLSLAEVWSRCCVAHRRLGRSSFSCWGSTWPKSHSKVPQLTDQRWQRSSSSSKPMIVVIWTQIIKQFQLFLKLFLLFLKFVWQWDLQFQVQMHLEVLKWPH